MTTRCGIFWLVPLACLSTNACQYDHDKVLAGYYAQDGGKALTAGKPMPESASEQRAQGVARSGGGTSTAAAGVGAQPVDGGQPAGNVQGETSANAGAAQDPWSQAGAQSQGNIAGADGGNQRGTMGPQAGGAAAGPCDLSGRWLVTSHLTTDALGALQYGHYFEYFEIEQQGDAFTVTRGFMCGVDAKGDGSLAADVDFSGSNASLPSKVRYDGRTGTSTQVSEGCQIELENWYTVRGVTTPYYLDPTHPLPTADQPATATSPGWEDWDNDGNPGITGVLSGIVSGKIFVGPRVWTAMSGTVTDTSKFRLAVKWGQEQNVMGYDGSALLGTEAAVGPDADTHFAQFVRLAPDQATGDELAICDAVNALAPQLTPEAAGM